MVVPPTGPLGGTTKRQPQSTCENVAVSRAVCYPRDMITLELQQAQRDLPSLAEKALGGEDVFIAVGTRTLRLVPSTSGKANDPSGTRRPARSADDPGRILRTVDR